MVTAGQHVSKVPKPAVSSCNKLQLFDHQVGAGEN
jgi:hypothetical protein